MERKGVLMSETTAGDHVRVGWREDIKSHVIRSLFSWAVVGGRKHVEYLRILGFQEDRITGCYDVVNNAFFRNGARSFREDADLTGSSRPKPGGFLYVGRLAEEKNVATLLASWIAYREEGGDWPADPGWRWARGRPTQIAGEGIEVRLQSFVSRLALVR